jgi:RimJ/RimL family protein N-acetyltransferase
MNFPLPKLEGESVSLRWMASEDANGPYFDWISGNLFLEHLESSRDPITREGLREYIESQNNDSNTYFFGICDKSSGILIGTVKLSLIDWVSRTSSVGIILGPPETRGKGNGRDTLKTVCYFAFHHLNL